MAAANPGLAGFLKNGIRLKTSATTGTFAPPVLKQPLPAPQPAAAPPPSFLTRATTPTMQPPSPVAAPAPVPAPVPRAVPPPAPEFKPQAPTQSFGPGNSLIGQQIAAPSSGANSYDQQAAQYAQGAGMQGYTGQTDQARQMVLDQLKTMQNAPDRFALAQSNYDQFQKDSDPAYQQQLRGVGQKAAALGRVGAGMTTNDLTGALGQRQNMLSSERTRGLNQALENTMGDRLNFSNSIQSGAGLLGGQDLSMGQARSNAALGQASQFSNLGQNQYGREANATQQQNQQQQFQSGLDQQNIQNQISQQQLQQGGQQQAWQQQFAQQQLAAQVAAQQNTQYPQQYPTRQPTSAQYGAGSIGFQG